MKKIFILILTFFFAGLVGIIFPSLLNIQEHAAIPLFLIAIFLFLGSDTYSLALGLGFALFGEAILGLPSGIFMGPLIVIAICYTVILRFVDLKPLGSREGGGANAVTAAFIGICLLGIFYVAMLGTSQIVGGSAIGLIPQLVTYKIVLFPFIVLLGIIGVMRLQVYRHQESS